MRISDWSSDVCSSDLHPRRCHELRPNGQYADAFRDLVLPPSGQSRFRERGSLARESLPAVLTPRPHNGYQVEGPFCLFPLVTTVDACRSEEHTSELQSLMRI